MAVVPSFSVQGQCNRQLGLEDSDLIVLHTRLSAQFVRFGLGPAVSGLHTPLIISCATQHNVDALEDFLNIGPEVTYCGLDTEWNPPLKPNSVVNLLQICIPCKGVLIVQLSLLWDELRRETDTARHIYYEKIINCLFKFCLNQSVLKFGVEIEGDKQKLAASFQQFQSILNIKGLEDTNNNVGFDDISCESFKEIRVCIRSLLPNHALNSTVCSKKKPSLKLITKSLLRVDYESLSKIMKESPDTDWNRVPRLFCEEIVYASVDAIVCALIPLAIVRESLEAEDLSAVSIYNFFSNVTESSLPRVVSASSSVITDKTHRFTQVSKENRRQLASLVLTGVQKHLPQRRKRRNSDSNRSDTYCTSSGNFQNLELYLPRLSEDSLQDFLQCMTQTSSSNIKMILDSCVEDGSAFCFACKVKDKEGGEKVLAVTPVVFEVIQELLGIDSYLLRKFVILCKSCSKSYANDQTMVRVILGPLVIGQWTRMFSGNCGSGYFMGCLENLETVCLLYAICKLPYDDEFRQSFMVKEIVNLWSLK